MKTPATIEEELGFARTAFDEAWRRFEETATGAMCLGSSSAERPTQLTLLYKSQQLADTYKAAAARYSLAIKAFEKKERR